MTRCPRTSAPESPRGTVGNPVASIFRTARSCWQSPPITRASYCFGVCADVETVIFDPPSTTWQFVTMTPSCRTMNPVPTPFPCWTLPKRTRLEHIGRDVHDGGERHPDDGRDGLGRAVQ